MYEEILIILFLAFFILVGCAPLDFYHPRVNRKNRVNSLDSRP